MVGAGLQFKTITRASVSALQPTYSFLTCVDPSASLRMHPSAPLTCPVPGWYACATLARWARAGPSAPLRAGRCRPFGSAQGRQGRPFGLAQGRQEKSPADGIEKLSCCSYCCTMKTEDLLRYEAEYRAVRHALGEVHLVCDVNAGAVARVISLRESQPDTLPDYRPRRCWGGSRS